MILLENKITIFTHMVYAKKSEECRKKLEDEKNLYNQKLKEKEDELNNTASEIVKRRVDLANKNGYELVSKAHEENRIAELFEAERQLDQLLEKVKIRLKDYTKTENYSKYVLGTFVKALEDLDDDEIYVYLRDAESDALKEKILEEAKRHNISVEFKRLPEKFIGGLIISDKNGNYEINLSLSEKIEDSRYKIGSMLHLIMKEVEDWIQLI